jgi:tetratricopeptide (TPR) repeat protein
LESFTPTVRKQIEDGVEQVRARPNNAGVNGHLGMILHAYRLYDAASVYYLRASRLSWWNTDWLYYLAVTQAEVGKNDEAVVNFRRVTWILPGPFALRYRLGEALLRSGRTDEAAKVFRKLTSDFPEIPWSHYGDGEARIRQGDVSGAIQSFLDACSLFPEFKSAHYALASAYGRLGDAAHAEEELRLYRSASAAQPPLPDANMVAVHALEAGFLAFSEKAIKLAAAGDLRGAAEANEKAVESEPSYALPHINLISLYGGLGEFDLAERHFKEATRLAPNRADAYSDYAGVMVRRERDAEAETLYAKALSIDPSFPDAHYGLAEILEERHQTEEAIRHCELALEAKPDYAQAKELLRKLNSKKGSK